MLYGEYSVLVDGNALVIPFPELFGTWKTSGDRTQYDSLLERSSFPAKISKIPFIDFRRFSLEMQEGIHYDSNIPIGYGLGSSASFSAAVYDRYGKNNSEEEIKCVHKHLQEMENIFHGSSSGVDPLVSYYQKAIWLKKQDYNFPENDFNLKGLFLIPSGLVRDTKSLVSKFRKQLENTTYREHVENYAILIEEAIQYLVTKNTFDPENWKKLSLLQMKLFAPMIPNRIHQMWLRGLKSGRYFMKLCGAGGGGYFLCYYPSEKLSEKSDWLAL